eukprot:6198293-Pleurochrysis_carterae.AAC.2
MEMGYDMPGRCFIVTRWALSVNQADVVVTSICAASCSAGSGRPSSQCKAPSIARARMRRDGA